MPDYEKDAVDWRKVQRKLVQANDALADAEAEMASGFTDDGDGDIIQIALNADDMPHDVDELIKGVTNSSSYLRNGTMNYIPNR